MFKFNVVEENLSGCIPSDVTCFEHLSPQEYVLDITDDDGKVTRIPLCETCVEELARLFKEAGEKVAKEREERIKRTMPKSRTAEKGCSHCLDHMFPNWNCEYARIPMSQSGLKFRCDAPWNAKRMRERIEALKATRCGGFGVCPECGV